MIVTAWNNGAHHESGAGYGLKLAHEDMQYFDTDNAEINLTLEGNLEAVKVNINKPSFQDGTCRELIKKEIGAWLIKNDLARWPRGKPWKLCLEKTRKNEFIVHRTRLN